MSKTVAIAKEQNITKTQAVLAAVERYKQRQQKLLDAFDLDGHDKKFMSSVDKQLKILKKAFKAMIAKEIGLKGSYVDVSISREYDGNIQKKIQFVEFAYVKVTLDLGMMGETTGANIDVGYDRSKYDESSLVKYGFPSSVMVPLRELISLMESASTVLDDYKNIKKTLSEEAVSEMRRRLQGKLQSTKQLTDMQVT